MRCLLLHAGPTGERSSWGGKDFGQREGSRAMALGFEQLNSGGINIPLRTSESFNVSALIGRESIVSRLVGEHGRLLAFALPENESPHAKRRGRKVGSTNWTRERFWRKYTEAARHLRRPYRKTHLAVQMSLAYMTF